MSASEPDVVVVGAGLAGLFVCGDQRDTASLHGALASGRRAAEAVRRAVS